MQLFVSPPDRTPPLPHSDRLCYSSLYVVLCHYIATCKSVPPVLHYDICFYVYSMNQVLSWLWLGNGLYYCPSYSTFIESNLKPSLDIVNVQDQLHNIFVVSQCWMESSGFGPFCMMTHTPLPVYLYPMYYWANGQKIRLFKLYRMRLFSPPNIELLIHRVLRCLMVKEQR